MKLKSRKPRTYTLDEIKAMEYGELIRKSRAELTPEEVTQYLYSRPEFEKRWKALNNAHVMKDDEGQDFQNAVNEWMDELYENGELPAQMVVHIAVIGENMNFGVHWLGERGKQRNLLDIMRDNGMFVDYDGNSARGTLDYATRKLRHAKAVPAWM